MGRITVLVAVALATTLLVIGASALQGDDTLSPGPIHEEHTDAGCNDCHSAWQGVPDEKCLDCHDEVENPDEATGASHANYTAPCDSCHTDHRGRDGRLTVSVDHDASTGDCVDCHERELREEFPDGTHWDTGCGDCHSVDTWSDIDLDHDQYFQLRSEGHYGLDCSDCHPSGDYRETTCANGWGCHAEGTFKDWKRHGGDLESFDDDDDEHEEDHEEEDDDEDELEDFEKRYREELDDDDDEEDDDD